MLQLQASKIPLAPDIQIQFLLAKLTRGISFYYPIIKSRKVYNFISIF